MDDTVVQIPPETVVPTRDRMTAMPTNIGGLKSKRQLNAMQPMLLFKGLVSYVLLEGDPPEDLINFQEQPMEGELLKKDITLNGHEGACKHFVDACQKVQTGGSSSYKRFG